MPVAPSIEGTELIEKHEGTDSSWESEKGLL
jgi:hypothetical protein